MEKKLLSVGIALLLISSFVFAEAASPTNEYITIIGTVRYIPLEGGFYGIIADNGKHYDPANLDIEFRKDGLRVQLAAKELEGVVSFHMWGQFIDIVEINTLPAPKRPQGVPGDAFLTKPKETEG